MNKIDQSEIAKSMMMGFINQGIMKRQSQ